MQITIFLDTEEADYFCKIVPAASAAADAIKRAIRTREYWGHDGKDLVVVCDDTEGAELLRYAQWYCVSAIEKIRRAFRLAHLRMDGEDRHWRTRSLRSL